MPNIVRKIGMFFRNETLRKKKIIFSKRNGVICAYHEEDLIGARLQVAPRERMMIFSDFDKGRYITGTLNDWEFLCNCTPRDLEDAGTHYLHVPYTTGNADKESLAYKNFILTWQACLDQMHADEKSPHMIIKRQAA